MASSTASLTSINVLRLLVFADLAMMVPDFSGDNKKRGAETEQVAERFAKAKEAVAQQLESLKTQSRVQDALKQRSDELDPAAPDSSKSDTLHAVREASHQAADASSGSSTSAGESSVSTSESPDASQHQAQQPAEGQSRYPEKLPQIAKSWGGQNVVTGQLHLHGCGSDT